MANQPKPAPRPEPPKPAPKPDQPPNQPHPGGQPSPKPGDRQAEHGERPLDDDDTGYLHDERNDPGPEHDRARDRRTGEIPGTPYTPPEGHDHREPGPGEPGGPGKPGGPGAAPATRTIADEQRERSDRMAAHGVEQHKAEHDERTGNEPRQVPGVSPTAGITPGEPGAIKR